MKTNALTLGLLAAALFVSCFAPIHSTFESARMLDQGQISLRGSYSAYYGLSYPDDIFGNTNNNLGLAIGYGNSDRFNMAFRFERLNTKVQAIELFNQEYDFGNLSYVELSGKLQLRPDRIAVSLPMGMYFFRQGTVFSLDPRLFLTFGGRGNFDFSIIPNAQLLVGSGGIVIPGVIFGCGFSSDLDRWAIRPEFGFNGFLNFGVGMNYNLR